MTSTPPIPKADRPAAIEALLRSHRAENPGTWPRYQEVLSAVGGSERDFAPLMRETKHRILSEELVLTQPPELPDDLEDAAKRFVTECWRQATTLADSNAAELQRARQADRLAMDEERSEMDAMVGRLVDERDAERARADDAEGREAALREALEKEHTAREEAETRLEEIRALFRSIGFTPPSEGAPGAKKPDEPTKASGSGNKRSSASAADVEPEGPELPFE
jgi:chromosome segregation ATPase